MEQESPLSESEKSKAEAFQRDINFELLRAKSHQNETGYLPIPYFIQRSNLSPQTPHEVFFNEKSSVVTALMRLLQRIKRAFFGEF